LIRRLARDETIEERFGFCDAFDLVIQLGKKEGRVAVTASGQPEAILGRRNGIAQLALGCQRSRELSLLDRQLRLRVDGRIGREGVARAESEQRERGWQKYAPEAHAGA
jgi:hypothetical protein